MGCLLPLLLLPSPPLQSPKAAVTHASPPPQQGILGKTTPASHCGWDDMARELRAAALEVSRLNSGSKSDWGPQTLLTPTCPWSSLGWGPSSAKPGSAHLCPTHLSLLQLIHPTLSSLTPLARLRDSDSYTRSLAIRLHED